MTTTHERETDSAADAPTDSVLWHRIGETLLRWPLPARVRSAIEGGHLPRLGKYLTGSVLSGIVSTLTFFVLFATGVLGSRGASLAASGTGAIVSYYLNRRWAWERRERAHFRREVVPYWLTVAVTGVAVALLTGVANAVVHHLTDDRALRTVTNTVAFVGGYGLSFVVKYWVFDRLFRTRHASRTGSADATELRLDEQGVSPSSPAPSTPVRAR